ncbi:hypothetical protein AAMO2058_000450800 [Amorphochlora amoebiformis]
MSTEAVPAETTVPPTVEDKPIEDAGEEIKLAEEDEDEEDEVPELPAKAAPVEDNGGQSSAIRRRRGRGDRRRSSVLDEILETKKRNEKLMFALAEKAPSFLQLRNKDVEPYLKMVIPFLAAIAAVIDKVAPVIYKYSAMAYTEYKKLPEEYVWGFFGFLMCFFGGVYPVLFVATETFFMCGYDETRAALMDLYNTYAALRKKNEEDDKKDVDGDGIADVNEISSDELFMRKVDLFLVTCDPQKIVRAGGVLYGTMLAITAVLRVHFAKTIAIGNAIGDVIVKTVGRFAVPVLLAVLPEKYHKWVPVLVSYISKSIGVSIAWTVQSVVSAFHSAIKGGFIMARMGMQWHAKQKGRKFDDTETSMDEILGFAIATLGFGIQLKSGFMLPFPLNILLLPLSITEWWIRYVIADSSMFVETHAD